MTLHSTDFSAQDAICGSMLGVWTMQAHDIRNIAARLVLASDELMSAEDARTRLLGERIARACDRIVETCQGAADALRPGASPRLREVIEDACAIAAAGAGPRTEIRWHCDADMALGASATAVFRILSNLANNAVVALNGAEGGQVSIRASVHEDTCRVTIEDSGTGAQPRERGAGTGLGLIVSTALAEEIGAHLERVRYEANGTAFVLTLPKDHSSEHTLPDA